MTPEGGGEYREGAHGDMAGETLGLLQKKCVLVLSLFNPFSSAITFIGQNPTSVDVRF